MRLHLLSYFIILFIFSPEIVSLRTKLTQRRLFGDDDEDEDDIVEPPKSATSNYTADPFTVNMTRMFEIIQDMGKRVKQEFLVASDVAEAKSMIQLLSDPSKTINQNTNLDVEVLDTKLAQSRANALRMFKAKRSINENKQFANSVLKGLVEGAMSRSILILEPSELSPVDHLFMSRMLSCDATPWKNKQGEQESSKESGPAEPEEKEEGNAEEEGEEEEL